MRAGCAFKNCSTTDSGKFESPKSCKKCPGVFRRKQPQMETIQKDICITFLPDVDTMMKVKK